MINGGFKNCCQGGRIKLVMLPELLLLLETMVYGNSIMSAFAHGHLLSIQWQQQ